MRLTKEQAKQLCTLLTGLIEGHRFDSLYLLKGKGDVDLRVRIQHGQVVDVYYIREDGSQVRA